MMKLKDRYPHAYAWTKELTVLRKHIDSLQLCAERSLSAANALTARYEVRVGRGTMKREDHLCRAIDAEAELSQLSSRYAKLKDETNVMLDCFENTSAAIVLRMLYVYGSDKTLVKSMIGLSKSSYYHKLECGMAELEKALLKREAA